jgi:tetratricopeptide (TPR) repeat protein
MEGFALRRDVLARIAGQGHRALEPTPRESQIVEARSETPDVQKLNAVAAAIRARDAAKAGQLAEAELSRGVQHPLLFTARAIALSESGRHQDALSDFDRAAHLSPNASAWTAVGVCLTNLERHEEAAEAFGKAIALQPSAAMLYYRRGRAFEQARVRAPARADYLRAIELDPRHAPALGRLALGEAQQGAWTDARAYADRALGIDPQHQAARLAHVMADVRTDQFDRAEQGLNDFLSDNTIDEQNRATALGELGDLRDRQGRVDEAFEAYAQANKLSEKSYKATTTAANVSMMEMVSSLVGYFENRPRLPRPPGPRVPTRTHAFLLGFLRSGTTLLEQILASHPDVVTLEEKAPMVDAVRHFMRQPRDLGALYRATEQELYAYREDYWRNVREYGVDPTDKVFIDKGPIYTVDLPVILRLFPDAKILFAVRDPRDVVLSCFRTRFAMNSTTYELLTLEGAANLYADVMRLAEMYRAVIPMDLHEVRHEALVRDFEVEARKICDVLGLDWNESMRNFAERSSLGTVSSASGPQIARGLNQEGVGRWPPYRNHMAAVLPILQPWVEKFGYEP